jgi:hypothetical protein
VPQFDLMPRSQRRRRSSSGGKEEIAIDVFDHVVYAAATGIAYEALSANGRL